MKYGVVLLVVFWTWSVMLMSLILLFVMGVMVLLWSGILLLGVGSAVAVAFITFD